MVLEDYMPLWKKNYIGMVRHVMVWHMLASIEKYKNGYQIDNIGHGNLITHIHKQFIHIHLY